MWHSVQFSSVQSLRCVRLFATPWTAARQASPSITNSWSLLRLMPIESVVPSNHLVLYRPLLLPPSISPSIRLFSSESVRHIRWPQYWSFSFNISPLNEHSGLISFRVDWLDLLTFNTHGSVDRVRGTVTPAPLFCHPPRCISTSHVTCCPQSSVHPQLPHSRHRSRLQRP